MKNEIRIGTKSIEWRVFPGLKSETEGDLVQLNERNVRSLVEWSLRANGVVLLNCIWLSVMFTYGFIEIEDFIAIVNGIEKGTDQSSNEQRFQHTCKIHLFN